MTNNKIIRNTFSLYIRLAINLILTFFTTRFILQSLGASDYGINNVISSIVTFCSFFINAIALSVQRYFSIALGQKNLKQLEIYYNASLRISIILGIFFLIIGEILTLFIFNRFLNIPTDRLLAAQLIYQCTLASFFFTIVRITFTALINAFEDINIVAILGIIESIGKLLISILILYSQLDKLVFLGVLSLIVTILISIMYFYFTKHKYDNIKIHSNKISISTYKDLGKFTGLSAIMSVSVVAKEQGIVVLINLFGGTIFNAAYGISSMVQGQIKSFTSMMFNAVVPRITSDIGNGDIDRSNRLMVTSSKFAFFVFTLIALPIYLTLPFLLKIWLKSFPDYSVEFCRLQLIMVAIDTLVYPLTISINAHGSIKGISILMFLLNIFTLVISYILLFLGLNLISIMYVNILNVIILGCIRIYYAQKLISMPVVVWLRRVCFPSILPLLISYVFSLVLISTFDRIILSNHFIFIFSLISCCTLIWYIGFDKNERLSFKKLILKIIRHEKENQEIIGKKNS